MDYKFINASKYLFIPAKYAFNIYNFKELITFSSKCKEKSQNLSIPKDSDIITYTDKIFSYMGSSQQMNLHIIKNPLKFINDNLYLFNPHFLKKRPLIKTRGKELNFFEKEIFFKLYYLTNLYEGWIESDLLEFDSPFLNKMLGKKNDFSFLVPFYWIRTFKTEIHNIGIKNSIYIAPRINFKINNLCSLKNVILKDKFQELYIKQQIAGFLLKELKENIYTLNLNNYKIYSPYRLDYPYLKTIGVD